MTTTSAYVSTVKADRTILLPQDVPVGAKVAVILLPAEEDEPPARDLRFETVLDSIRAAINSNYTTPKISTQELKQLIVEARQATQS